MGDLYLVSAVTFYSADHPDSVPSFALEAAPWVTPARLEREGRAAICMADDRICTDAGRRRVANKVGVAFIDAQVSSRFLGSEGKSRRFLFILVPPQ